PPATLQSRPPSDPAFCSNNCLDNAPPARGRECTHAAPSPPKAMARRDGRTDTARRPAGAAHREYRRRTSSCGGIRTRSDGGAAAFAETIPAARDSWKTAAAVEKEWPRL